MRRFSSLSAIPLSFFSKDLYRDVARHWKGAGILYLLLVIVPCVILQLVSWQVTFTSVAKQDLIPLANEVPPIVIRDGHVSSTVEMPYIVKDASQRTIAIFDTTGQYTSLEGTDARALLTANRLVFRKSAYETRVMDLSGVRHFEFGEKQAAAWLRLLAFWLIPALSPFIFVGLFLYRLCGLVLLAGLGMLVAGPLGVRLDFAAMMRLSAVAMTPAMASDTLRSVTGIHLPMGWVFGAAIAFVYLLFAIGANREAAPTPPDAPPAPI